MDDRTSVLVPVLVWIAVAGRPPGRPPADGAQTDHVFEWQCNQAMKEGRRWRMNESWSPSSLVLVHNHNWVGSGGTCTWFFLGVESQRPQVRTSRV